ncbi:MAG TPA: hypothetical protein VF665_09720, partial [Longimicrobium sp.]
MKRVIERCPNCGVEHDDAVGGACEVCGTSLRFWCRVHSKEIGWLDSAECPRCAAEATARPAPPVPPAPVEAPRAPEPAPPPRVVPPEARWRRRIRVPMGAPPREYERAPGPPAGREPHVIIREGAEDLRPYVVTGAGAAFRLIRALFAVVRWAIFGAVVGGVAGG